MPTATAAATREDLQVMEDIRGKAVMVMDTQLEEDYQRQVKVVVTVEAFMQEDMTEDMEGMVEEDMEGMVEDTQEAPDIQAETEDLMEGSEQQVEDLVDLDRLVWTRTSSSLRRRPRRRPSSASVARRAA